VHCLVFVSRFDENGTLWITPAGTTVNSTTSPLTTWLAEDVGFKLSPAFETIPNATGFYEMAMGKIPGSHPWDKLTSACMSRLTGADIEDGCTTSSASSAL